MRSVIRFIFKILGWDSYAKIEMMVFTIVVAILLRNEVVIWIARAGFDEFWTRVLIYGIGGLLMVGGAHFNAWIMKIETRRIEI